MANSAVGFLTVAAAVLVAILGGRYFIRRTRAEHAANATKSNGSTTASTAEAEEAVAELQQQVVELRVITTMLNGALQASEERQKQQQKALGFILLNLLRAYIDGLSSCSDDYKIGLTNALTTLRDAAGFRSSGRQVETINSLLERIKLLPTTRAPRS